jgi:hypothetical protein
MNLAMSEAIVPQAISRVPDLFCELSQANVSIRNLCSNMSMQTETARLASLYADKVNHAIAEYELSDQSGIQTFGAELRKMVKEFGLAVHETMHHSKVCPHEDNRDGELLIPIAVWRLLLMITRKGWSHLECALALACGIPSNSEGDRWKAKAMKLADQSDGLLAPYRPELLQLATAAGSHTTAVLRLLEYCATRKVPCPKMTISTSSAKTGSLVRPKFW